MARKGMAKGTGKGYKNMMANDKRVHSMSAKGIKQPQKLCSVLLKSGNMPDSRFDATQLKMGTKVETEHTDNKCIAKQIAKAHILEIHDYYSRLKKLEDEAKKEQNYKYKKGWSLKSTVPIVDYPESFGYKGKLIWMSPREFLKKAQSGYGSEETRNMSEEEHRKQTEYIPSIEKTKQGLIKGNGEVPIGYLEINEDGRIDHEGRNRAWASIDLGIEKIPVKVIWKPNYNNKPKWVE